MNEERIEKLEALAAAISNRVDQVDRDKLVEKVVDGRKAIVADERHAELQRHKDDIVPHTYRDYVDNRPMPRLREILSDASDTSKDQFLIVKYSDTATFGGTQIKVRGGVWQFNVRTWESGVYKEIITVVAPSNGDITWAGDTDHEDMLSVAYTMSASKSLWAKLDRSSVTPVLTLVMLTLGAAPTAAAEIYWHKIGDILFAGGFITSVEQWHSGSIRSELDPKTGATTTTVQPSTSAASSDTWRSHENKELTIDRFRTFLNSSDYYVRVLKHTETYGSNGRLLSVGAETVVDTLDLEPTDITVVTNVNYNTSTGVLKFTSRTAKVLSAGATADTTIDTAEDCPT